MENIGIGLAVGIVGLFGYSLITKEYTTVEALNFLNSAQLHVIQQRTETFNAILHIHTYTELVDDEDLFRSIVTLVVELLQVDLTTVSAKQLSHTDWTVFKLRSYLSRLRRKIHRHEREAFEASASHILSVADDVLENMNIVCGSCLQ